MNATMASTLHELLLLGLETLLLFGAGVLHRLKASATKYYVSRTSATQREWLRLVGVEAFHYAERAYAALDGPAKLNEAVKYVLDRAGSLGLDISYPEIRAVIEKAWTEANVEKK